MTLKLKITAVTAAAILAAGFFPSGIEAGGLDTLSIKRGARAGVFGGAFVSVADETNAVYYNPAGLAFMYSPEIFVSQSILAAEDKLTGFGYAFPTDAGTFALAMDYLAGPPLAGVFEGAATRSFSYYTAAGNFGYSFRMTEGLGLGINLRHAIDAIDTSVENLTAADAGFMLRTRDEGFSIGASATNLGLSGSANAVTVPKTYRGGFSFKWSLPEHYSDIILAAGYTLEDGKKPVYSAALEHVGAKVIGLRLGYDYSADDYQRTAADALSNFHAGAGVRFSNFQINYAYKPMSSLGESHRADVQWRFYGWGLRKKKLPAQLKVEPTVFSPNSDGAKDNVFFIPEAAGIKRVEMWELRVTSGNATVRKFSEREMPPKIIVWDGKDDYGGLAREGVYRVIFTAEDKHRMAVSDDKYVTVDLTPPSAALSAETTVFMPAPDGLGEKATFYASMSDAGGIDFWQIVVTNFRGKPVKVFRSTDSAKNSWAWNGLDDHYETAVPPGEYTATLTAVDAGGNRASSSLKARVVPKVHVIVKEVVREVEVAEGPRGLVMTLASSVLFESGKADIKPYAKRALDEVLEILRAYPENKVVIEGHTDSSGSDHRNKILSSRRAWGVYSYLVRSGVEPSRLTVRGMGHEIPRAANETASGRAMNRRVEIIIRKKEENIPPEHKEEKSGEPKPVTAPDESPAGDKNSPPAPSASEESAVPPAE